MTKLKEEIWASLKDRVNRALKHEKQNLGAVFLELKQLSRTLDELAEMKKDYHPDQLRFGQESASIGQLQRNWNFLTGLEEATRKTNQQKLMVKKKERAIRQQCLKLENELRKYEMLESREVKKRKKSEALIDQKLSDEIATNHWLRNRPV